MTKAIVMASWDDVPHLSDEQKKEILDSTPEFLRDSRSKGKPGLGAGAVYQIKEEEIMCDVQPIPPWWRRFYGMDVGWRWTAVAFFAHDVDHDVVYLYDVYKRSGAEAPVHASAIKHRYVGEQRIPGAIDPASNQRSQIDGRALLQLYRKEGLKLVKADNTREAGVEAVRSRLATGRLRVFRTLSSWFDEYRLYRRNDDGKIVKEDADHLLDATRYGIMSGLKIAQPLKNTGAPKNASGRRYF